VDRCVGSASIRFSLTLTVPKLRTLSSQPVQLSEHYESLVPAQLLELSTAL
jgi:hypothetical protein